VEEVLADKVAIWHTVRLMNQLIIACFLVVGASFAAAETPSAPVVSKNVPYVDNGHERQKLDLFMPPGASSACPLLVWVHGGAWKGGSKENCPAVGMVAQGWVVASLNYRFSQHAIFPAQIEDCKAAVRFLRANADKYKIDKGRVAAWGASAGGHLVAMLGTTGQTKEFDVGAHLDQSSAVSCVINWFGPADFLRWKDGTIIKPSKNDDVVAKLFGGPVMEHQDLAKKASPLYFVDKNSAPMLLMHGDKDSLVPVQQSRDLYAALEKAGVESKLQIYPNTDHGGPVFTDEAARKLMVEFVEKHAGKAK
jgi:acetyl esterase/lipase